METEQLGDARVHQFGIGVDEYTLARLDRLRAVTGRSRNTVARLCLRHGVRGVERQYAEGVRLFDALAARHGVTWAALAAEFALRYSRRTYPPTVGQLAETLDADGTWPA